MSGCGVLTPDDVAAGEAPPPTAPPLPAEGPLPDVPPAAPQEPQGSACDMEEDAEVEGEGDDLDIQEDTVEVVGVPGSSSGAELEALAIESEGQATEVRNRANQYMKDGEFEKGIDFYSAICQYYVRKYGPHAEECALHYYDYGEALLYQLQETPAGVDAEQGEGDAAALAWEALELAMQLYTRKVEELAARPEAEAEAEALREAELMLATVHCRLGDLGMEGDSYPTVLVDFAKCAELRAKHLPAGDRRLAEPHYQLGLAHELLGDLPAAVRHLRLALAVLRADPAHAELAAGVALKVEDLEEEIQRAPAEEGQAKAMLKDALLGLVPSLATAAAADPSTLTPLQLQAMSVSDLRAVATRLNVDTANCCEKADLVECVSRAISSQGGAPAHTAASSSSAPSPAAAAGADGAARTLAPRKRVRPANPADEPPPPPGRSREE
eukprot:EG_transcript_11319